MARDELNFRFFCPHCTKAFPRTDKLNRHITDAHPDADSAGEYPALPLPTDNGDGRATPHSYTYQISPSQPPLSRGAYYPKHNIQDGSATRERSWDGPYLRSRRSFRRTSSRSESAHDLHPRSSRNSMSSFGSVGSFDSGLSHPPRAKGKKGRKKAKVLVKLSYRDIMKRQTSPSAIFPSADPDIPGLSSSVESFDQDADPYEMRWPSISYSPPRKRTSGVRKSRSLDFHGPGNAGGYGSGMGLMSSMCSAEDLSLSRANGRIIQERMKRRPLPPRAHHSRFVFPSSGTRRSVDRSAAARAHPSPQHEGGQDLRALSDKAHQGIGTGIGSLSGAQQHGAAPDKQAGIVRRLEARVQAMVRRVFRRRKAKVVHL